MGSQKPAKTAALSVTGLAHSGAGRLGAVMITPGSDATTVTIYDSKTAASGQVVFGPVKLAAAAKTELFMFVPGVAFATGLWVEITGTSVSVLPYVY